MECTVYCSSSCSKCAPVSRAQARYLEKHGFDACGEGRFIWTTQPEHALFAVTAFIQRNDQGKWVAEFAFDTESTQNAFVDYTQMENAEFDSPTEAADFVLDELEQGLKDVLEMVVTARRWMRRGS